MGYGSNGSRVRALSRWPENCNNIKVCKRVFSAFVGQSDGGWYSSCHSGTWDIVVVASSESNTDRQCWYTHFLTSVIWPNVCSKNVVERKIQWPGHGSRGSHGSWSSRITGQTGHRVWFVVSCGVDDEGDYCNTAAAITSISTAILRTCRLRHWHNAVVVFKSRPLAVLSTGDSVWSVYKLFIVLMIKINKP